jgi:Na+/H+ antiporter NhaD/arsenite permease-like protein
VWLLSGALDNIAAALIGAAAAQRVFGRVHVGYAAAIVAAANAGGAGSVIGDTTTTMMWLDHVGARAVAPAYLGAAVALLVFGTAAAMQQTRYAPMLREAAHRPQIDKVRVIVVAATITALALTNIVANVLVGTRAEALPLLGGIVWVVLAVGALFRPINWSAARRAAHGAVFLVALVVSASLLPVEALPRASFVSTVALGFVSAVFDNIPLTKVALVQGGYDWAVLAYSVGFGGSMIWFG